jgi:hypothetical protein
MGVVVTKGERGAVMFERGGWGRFGVGDRAVQLSVGIGIVRNRRYSRGIYELGI